MNFSINNETMNIITRSLKWEDDGYVAFGNGTQKTIREEVVSIFDSVWTTMMDSISFSRETTPTEMYQRIVDDTLYTIEVYYRAGRYQSFMDMCFVANASVDFIWKYMDMSKNYKEEDDHKHDIVF